MVLNNISFLFWKKKNACILIVLNIIFVSQSLETFLTYEKVYDKHPKSGLKIKRVLLIVHFEQTNALAGQFNTKFQNLEELSIPKHREPFYAWRAQLVSCTEGVNCRIHGDGYADILLRTSMCLSVLKSIQYKYTHNVTVEVRVSCFDSAGSREVQTRSMFRQWSQTDKHFRKPSWISSKIWKQHTLKDNQSRCTSFISATEDGRSL